MSNIKVKKSTMVCPAEETPKGSLWLSKLDMFIRQPYSHTNVLYLYSPNNTTSSSKFFDINIFKEALSKALVPFCPMAADGASHLHFNNSRARLAKGLDLSVYLVHDRATYLAPRSPPQVKFRHLEYEPPLPPLTSKGLSGETEPTTECTFTLTKDQIYTIKLRATSQEMVLDYKQSTYEVQAGHVWRIACLARINR
uniref:Uncharacterized protein n=1 Tax=Chenopodium quinoa TaxID=63459 RepID=A0A803L0E9_CHEQI